MKKTTLLKKMILDPEILIMPGAYDALSARIIGGGRLIAKGEKGCRKLRRE